MHCYVFKLKICVSIVEILVITTKVVPIIGSADISATDMEISLILVFGMILSGKLIFVHAQFICSI